MPKQSRNTKRTPKSCLKTEKSIFLPNTDIDQFQSKTVISNRSGVMSFDGKFNPSNVNKTHSNCSVVTAQAHVTDENSMDMSAEK